MLSSLVLNPQNVAIACALALIIGLSTGAGSIWYVKGLQIDALKSDHAAQFAELKAKAATAELDASKFKLDFDKNLEDKRNELDQKYDSRVAAVNSSVSKLSGIRLRDPSANSNSGTTGGQGSATGDLGSSTDAGGLLSPQTSQFLWSLAGESQIYLDRLNQCKAWNAELSAESQKYYDQIMDLKKKND